MLLFDLLEKCDEFLLIPCLVLFKNHLSVLSISQQSELGLKTKHVWVCDRRGCGFNSEKLGWSTENVVDTHKRLPSSPADVLTSCPDSLPVEVDMPGCGQSLTYSLLALSAKVCEGWSSLFSRV